MRQIDLQIRTADSHTFAGYGSCIPYPNSESTEPGDRPTSSGGHFSWYGRILVDRFGDPVDANGVLRGSELSFGMVVASPNDGSGPLEQTLFERHQRTAEMLIPLDGDVVMILAQRGAIARPWYDEHRSGAIDPVAPERFGAFVIPAGRTVLVASGVWHYAPFALQGRTRVLVAYYANTERDDVDTVDLAELGAKVVATR